MFSLQRQSLLIPILLAACLSASLPTSGFAETITVPPVYVDPSRECAGPECKSLVRPPVECEGQNCLPANENPVIECEGQNCLPPSENPVIQCEGMDCMPPAEVCKGQDCSTE